MVTHAHLETLVAKHHLLNEKINEAYLHHLPDEKIVQLKKRRLGLKDQLVRLRKQQD